MSVDSRRRRAVPKRSGRRAAALATGAAAAALPVLTFLGTAPGMAAEADSFDCGHGGVFVVAGTDDRNNVNTRGLEARYTAQGYVINHVDYPATFWPLGAQSYDANIETGKAALTRDVVAYQRACEGYPVVIVGYSQGARIAGDVLADIASDEPGEIDPEGVSGELYSDPRRRGDATGAGAEVNLINAFPGAMLDGERENDFGDIPVYSVCIDGDPACDLPDLRRDPIGALDALVGFWVKHMGYGAIMAAGPQASVGDGISIISSSDGAKVVFVEADPAMTTVLARVGLPNLLRSVILDLPYAELAIIQPISRAILGLLPALPQLGHGAYLTDLYALRDALSGNPAAWTAIFGSAVSVVTYPVNFVRDWVAVIDAVLDHRDPDLGFLAAPTVRTVAVAAFGAVSQVGAHVGGVITGSTDAGDSQKVLAVSSVDQSQASADVIPEPGRHRAPEVSTPDVPAWNGPDTADVDQGPDGSDTTDSAGTADSADDQEPAADADPPIAETAAATGTTPIDTSADLAAAS